MQPILTEENCPRRVSVMGAGRSGVAAARIFVDLGSRVFISDSCTKEKLDFMLATNGLAQVNHEAGEHTRRVLDADVIILSPGIRSDIPLLRQAQKAGIAVWSEMELGFRISRAPWLAVTGSTGKSTTVSLLGSVMAAAGRRHVVAGNIGLPVSTAVRAIPAEGVIVAEVSSFQLENIDRFKPRGAAVLNLLKNHLDRYDSEEGYYDAKKQIIRNMDSADTLVLNGADERLVQWAQQIGGQTRIMYCGRPAQPGDAVWHEDGIMYLRRDDQVGRLLDVRTMKLRGNHNYDNACAAAALALCVGVEPDAIAAGLCAFEGLKHRLEFVREFGGVRFYNDSKATTAESVVCAVNAFEHNVHLIAGGKDKGCDFSIVRDALRSHAKSVVLIGEATGRMQREWNGCAPLQVAASLQEAVAMAHDNAEQGDVVVLSPGCASFDMFRDFEQRGEVFRDIVNQLGSDNEKA